MKNAFASKIEENKKSISQMRKEIDEQRMLLIESKMENIEYLTVLEETQCS
jgi:hypothetical protein